jgi:hypothetical protein
MDQRQKMLGMSTGVKGFSRKINLFTLCLKGINLFQPACFSHFVSTFDVQAFDVQAFLHLQGSTFQHQSVVGVPQGPPDHHLHLEFGSQTSTQEL